MKRRVLSMFLATAMVLSAVDITVFAYEKGNEYAVAFEAGMEVTANPAEEITIDSNEELIVTPTTEEDSEEKSQEPASESPEESKKEESIEEPEEVTEELTEEPEDELIEDEQDTVIPEEEEENTETTTLPEKTEADTTEMPEVIDTLDEKENHSENRITTRMDELYGATYELEYYVVEFGMREVGTMYEKYELEESEKYVSVCGYSGEASGQLIIPDTIEGYPVKEISGFYKCTGFTGGLVLPPSLEKIEDAAFAGCTGFTGELVLPSSVEEIGNSAFAGCTGFTGELVLSANLTKIGNKAFDGCNNFIGKLILPSNVEDIGSNAFRDCTGFSELEIQSGGEIIGAYAFDGCIGFTGDLLIPEGIKEIDEYAFYGCTGFSGKLGLPSSLETIDDYAFYGCTGFTGELKIPENVSEVGFEAFRDCIGFTGKLVIPENVISIGQEAFMGCTGFTELEILSKVEQLDGTFSGCTGFTGKLTIPSSVKIIGSCTFEGCTGFTGKLTIPSSVEEISYGAFKGCNSFTELEILFGVEIIGECAFEGCTGFTSGLVLPVSVKKIGKSAFKNCTGFTGKLKLPSYVETIDDYAFYGCTGFTGELILPSYVKTIGDYAFYKCTGFTGNLTIPGSVEVICYSAFYECTGFTGNLIISEGVTTIEACAFAWCEGFEHIYLPQSLMCVSDGSFLGCFDVIMHCVTDSYAYIWALEYGFEVIAIEKASVAQIEIERDKHKIYVYDSVSEIPISEAVVTISGNEYKTSDEGFVTFSATDSEVKLEIQIVAEGYVTVETIQKVKNGTVTRIGMNADSSSILVASVIGEIDGNKYDLLSDKLVLGYVSDLSEITHTTDQNLFITVKTNDVAVKYEIVSRNSENDDVQETVVISSDNGKFTIPVSTGGTTVDNDTISASMPVLSRFEPGVQYFVKVTNSNGDSTSKPIGISTTTNYLTAERRYQSGSMKLGEKLEIQISDDIPLIGGGKLNFGFKNAFPVEVYADEDGTFRVALNKPVDKTIDEYEKNYKRIKEKAKNASAVSKAMGTPVNGFDAGYFTVNGKVCGYGEGNISELNQGKVSIKLEIMAEIEGKGGYKQYFITPVYIPVNLFVEGSVKGSVGVQGKLNIEDWKISGFDYSGGAFNVKVSMTAGGGVGAGLEVNASVTGNINYEWKPVRDYQRLWLEASGKVTAVAWVFEKDLWKSKEYKYTIYEDGKDDAVSMNVFSEDNQTQEFHSLDRTYLDYSSGYNRIINSVNTVNSNTSDLESVVIKQAIYPAANPKIIQMENSLYIFWLEDIISRNANNRTALVYAKSENGVLWSAPCRLLYETEDNTLDGNYDITKQGKNIVITWQDASRPIEESDNILTVAETMKVRKVVFDTETDKVVDDRVLTEESGYYLYPCTEIVGEDTYTAYVVSGLETNDISGNNTHSLYYAKNDEQAQMIGLPIGSQVINMESGTINDQVYVICELDVDGDNATYNDHEIYAFGLTAGTSIQLTDNEVCDTMPTVADSGNIYWYQEGNIISSKGVDGEVVPIWEVAQLQSPIVLTAVTDANGLDTLLWETADLQKEDGSVAIYSICQNADESWGTEIVFAQSDSTIASRVSAVINAGDILVAHLEGTFLEDGSMLKDLCVVAKEEFEDISVDYVEFEEETAVSGAELPLQVGITNTGNTVIDNVVVSINGNTGYSVSDFNLQQGESEEITITGFSVPTDLQTPENFTVQILAAKENRETDNSAEFILGCPDLKVEADTRLEDGNTWIDFNVWNNAVYPSTGTVKVHVDTEDGDVIAEKAFESLDKNSSYAWTVSLEEYENVSTRYYIEVVADKIENLTGDNILFVYTGYGTGVESKEEDVSVDNVTALALNQNTCNMQVGETSSLVVTSGAEELNYPDLILCSSDKTVANVSENGIITAYRAGTACITAYYGELSAECQVTVIDNKEKRLIVQFDSQGGTRIDSITDIIPGSEIMLPESIEKENHAFLGWYTLPEGGEKISGNTLIVEKSMTLYAQWESDEYAPKGFWIQDITEQTYTGKAIKPIIKVYDGVTLLAEKTDYTISYKNNSKAYTYTDEDYAAFEENLQKTGKRVKIGTFDPKKAPQVTIKMKGNYSGSQIVYFKINKADISDETFTTNNLMVSYTGKKQTPAPTLIWNGKKLKYGTDFHVPEYDNAKKDKTAFSASQTYNLTIVGKGNFTGEIPITLTISESSKQITMDKVTIKGIKNLAWTGEQLKQSGFTVSYKKDVLSETNGDYTISWGENADVGIGTVTFTGTGLDADGDGYSYIGTKTVSFKITGTSMSKVSVSGVEKTIYSGKPIKPVATLTYKANKKAESVTLIENKHYIVTYQKNQDKGTATIIFTGLESGGYTGTKKVTFKIVSRGIGDIKDGETTVEQINVAFKDVENIQDGIYVAPYMKGGVKPEVIVTSGDKILELGKDYTISYSNNKKVALFTDKKAPTITIKGKGNYVGSKNVCFTIAAKTLSNENGITVVAKDKVESTKKNGYRQSFKVYDADGKALGNSDYDSKNVTYTLIQIENEDGTVSTVNEVLDKNSIVPANSVIQITVQGKGIYVGGKATGTYRILETNHDISKATIQISDQSYTGSPVTITEQSQFKPGKVYIKIGKEKKELILGEDIEVVAGSYEKNVNKGTAKVTFCGINDFGGTKTVSFRIGTRSITDYWQGIYKKVAEFFG